MSYYMALVHRNRNGFDITVPDLPGCTASGGSIAEAMQAGTQAMRLWADAERAAGREVPAPRSPAVVETDPDVIVEFKAGATTALLLMIANEGIKQRVNIMIDAGLLKAADSAAGTSGQTRSDFIAEALRAKIAG